MNAVPTSFGARYRAIAVGVIVTVALAGGIVLVGIDREVDAQMSVALANQRIHIEKVSAIRNSARSTYVLILERWLRPLPERAARELAIEGAVEAVRHSLEDFAASPALSDDEGAARNRLVTSLAMWSNRVHQAVIAADGPSATSELRALLDAIDETAAAVVDIDSHAGTWTDGRVSALHVRQAWIQTAFGGCAAGILAFAVAWWNGKARAERDFLRSEQAREELQRAEEVRTQFFANTSHELRTPLVAIRGCTALLAETSDVSDARGLAVQIDREAAELLGHIDNILDAAKLARGGVQVQLADVDVAQVVRRCVQRCAPLVASKPVEIRVDVASELPTAWSDSVKLGHVVTNLLANAIKFTDQGYVAVRARAGDPTRVVLEVQDTGVGIPTEALSRIWNPFEQADASVSRRFGGTGLGLAIVRGLLDLMGGEITVESAVGKGTMFAVSLPTAAAGGGNRV
jgi:signal transduction histidine kinase